MRYIELAVIAWPPSHKQLLPLNSTAPDFINIPENGWQS